jgi:hypothetical protein
VKIIYTTILRKSLFYKKYVLKIILKNLCESNLTILKWQPISAWRYVIFPYVKIPYVKIPNVTSPKLVIIPNIYTNPEILRGGKGLKLGEGERDLEGERD